MSPAPTFADFGIEIAPSARGEVRATCPRCSPDRRPEHRHEKDLSVNVEEGTWYCHHCGWSDGLRLKAPNAPPRRKVHTRPDPLEGELTDEALAFFASRGIPEDVVRRNQIVVVRDVFFPQLDGKRDAIAYPSFRNGELVSVKYRARGSKDFRTSKDTERILYGLDDIAGAETIVIVEGEMDKLALEAAGIRACVSVPDGAPAPDARNYASKFDFLADPAAEKALGDAKRIVLATDADEPGVKLAAELARRLGKERCWRVDWPDGIKDANEALVQTGAEYLAALIEDASPWPIEGIITPRDVYGEVMALYRGQLDPGTETGFHDLRWRIKLGQLIIVTGMPGSGKSEWVDALAVNLGKYEGWTTAFYSPENHPVERHVAKLVEKLSRRAVRKWREDSELITESELERSIEAIHQRFRFLAPEEPSLDNILELARKEVYRSGIKLLVIDPWNELDHQRPGGLSETEYISQALTKLRTFARHYGVAVIVIAHPAKMAKEGGEYPVPTPYDISGSAHWYNKADNCITVARNKADESMPIEVHIQKVRFRECGELGVYRVDYNPANGCFSPWLGGDAWTPGTLRRQ